MLNNIQIQSLETIVLIQNLTKQFCYLKKGVRAAPSEMLRPQPKKSGTGFAKLI